MIGVIFRVMYLLSRFGMQYHETEGDRQTDRQTVDGQTDKYYYRDREERVRQTHTQTDRERERERERKRE